MPVELDLRGCSFAVFFGEALCVWLCLSGLFWDCRMSWISGGARGAGLGMRPGMCLDMCSGMCSGMCSDMRAGMFFLPPVSGHGSGFFLVMLSVSGCVCLVWSGNAD